MEILKEFGIKTHSILFYVFLLITSSVGYQSFIPWSIFDYLISFLSLFIIWIVIFWVWYRVFLIYPRNKKGKVGIIIGILSENKEQYNKLKVDFINEFKSDIKKANTHGDYFEILELKDYQIEKILNSDNKIETIKKINKTVKGHFYIYGNMKEREDKYLINPSYMIFHPIINEGAKQRLQEILNILSLNIKFNKSEEIKGFEITKELISFNSKYIIGIAFLISGDLTLAYITHTHILKINIGRIRNDINSIFIKNELLKIINEEAIALSYIALKSQNINEYKKYTDVIIGLGLNKYNGYLQKAIYFFKILDIDSSLKAVKNAKSNTNALNNGEWRFNNAFLFLWIEDYIKFNNERKQILKKCRLFEFRDEEDKENQFIKDIIDFCDNELTNNSGKIQLYFWMGFICYKISLNSLKALEYFTDFIINLGENNHILKEEAIKYKDEINNQLGLQ